MSKERILKSGGRVQAGERPETVVIPTKQREPESRLNSSFRGYDEPMHTSLGSRDTPAQGVLRRAQDGKALGETFLSRGSTNPD